MGTAMRIILAIVCIIALYYLVVTLARSVASQSETGFLPQPAAELALVRAGP